MVRAHSKDSYVVILSGHIDANIEDRFRGKVNVAIAHKPTPDEQLGELLTEELQASPLHDHHRLGDAVARTTRNPDLATAAQTTGAAGRSLA